MRYKYLIALIIAFSTLISGCGKEDKKDEVYGHPPQVDEALKNKLLKEKTKEELKDMRKECSEKLKVIGKRVLAPGFKEHTDEENEVIDYCTTVKEAYMETLRKKYSGNDE